jgi:hypothetical protein
MGKQILSQERCEAGSKSRINVFDMIYFRQLKSAILICLKYRAAGFTSCGYRTLRFELCVLLEAATDRRKRVLLALQEK